MDKTYRTKTIQIKDIIKEHLSYFRIIDMNGNEYGYLYPDPRMSKYKNGDYISITYSEPISQFAIPYVQCINVEDVESDDDYEDRLDSEILSEIGVDQYGFTHFR